MVDLKVGDRVKVTHKAKHDMHFAVRTQVLRSVLAGRVGFVEKQSCGRPGWLVRVPDIAAGAWFEPDELEPAGADVEPSEHVKAITRAAEALAKREVNACQREVNACQREDWWKDKATEIGKERDELRGTVDAWIERCDALRAELVTEREARQAVNVLARQHGEAANHAQIGEGAARMQLSRVAAAWDAVQCSRRGGTVEDRHNAEDNMVRALAGVPAPEEASGGKAFDGLMLGEARGMARLFFAFRDRVDADEEALAGLLMRVSRGEKWTDRPEEAAAREEEPRECQVEIPRPVVPLGDVADLAALIAKVEAHPLCNRGGVVSSALLVDVLRAVERRLMAVETRRPKVGPWTTGGVLFDDGGRAVGSLFTSGKAGRPCGWAANRPNLSSASGEEATEDEAKAAVLAVLSSWCDVVPVPREP